MVKQKFVCLIKCLNLNNATATKHKQTWKKLHAFMLISHTTVLVFIIRHKHMHTHLCRRCWFGSICSSLLVFLSLKLSKAGETLDVKILMMPLGKESVMSPVIFTMHLKNKTLLNPGRNSDRNCIKSSLVVNLHCSLNCEYSIT